MNDEEYIFLKNKILKLTNFNLDNYKSTQMRRRLDGFISSANMPGVIPYCSILERDQNAVKKLRDFLTINVSEFFRDSTYFETLRNVVLQDMLRDRLRLNIWSAGCSNGAEAYSIAISLDSVSPQVIHRILATDIDEASLTKASSGGPYRIDEIRNVPQELLKKYFINTDEGYRIIEKIRQRVLFKRHDLLQDNFEQGFDLIVCRNVVIYFSNEAKNKLYQKFYGALKDGGVLFVGGTEAILDASDIGFQMLRTCFYRKPISNRSTDRVLISAR